MKAYHCNFDPWFHVISLFSSVLECSLKLCGAKHCYLYGGFVDICCLNCQTLLQREACNICGNCPSNLWTASCFQSCNMPWSGSEFKYASLKKTNLCSDSWATCLLPSTIFTLLTLFFLPRGWEWLVHTSVLRFLRLFLPTALTAVCLVPLSMTELGIDHLFHESGNRHANDVTKALHCWV